MLVDHQKADVTEACDYTELVVPITTTEGTRRARFILDTVIGGPYDQGHVTYDDCVLEKLPPEPK